MMQLLSGAEIRMYITRCQALCSAIVVLFSSLKISEAIKECSSHVCVIINENWQLVFYSSASAVRLISCLPENDWHLPVFGCAILSLSFRTKRRRALSKYWRQLTIAWLRQQRNQICTEYDVRICVIRADDETKRNTSEETTKEQHVRCKKKQLWTKYELMTSNNRQYTG